jgi:carbonic anhydrase
MKISAILKILFTLSLPFILPLALADAMTVNQPYAAVMTAEKQQEYTPQQVFQRLKDGNQRFVNGAMKNRDLLTQARITSKGQHPLAVILTCIDARTSPEIIFDQGVGDIFGVRIAGNIQNNDILGSMEFGTKVSGAKVIAVIGHTSCGAVRGACQNVKLGQLTALLAKIKPAVNQAKSADHNGTCDTPDFIDQIAKNNVALVIKQLVAQSPIIAKQLKDKQIIIIGGMQNLATGKVTFFE